MNVDVLRLPTFFLSVFYLNKYGTVFRNFETKEFP